MSDNASFPKLSSAQRTGAIGVTLVAGLVEKELRWGFRRNHQEDDFGIDGYVDIIRQDGAVLGKSFAVQIKTGPSHVAKTSDQGFLLYGDLKHLNYFLNSPVPVVLVWVDDAVNRAWWVHVVPHAIRLTKTGWSILIPRTNGFAASSSAALAALAGPTTDYLPLIRQMNVVRESVRSSGIILFLITKDEVMRGNVLRLQDFFRMFEAAPDVLPDIRHKLTLAVHGYDDDPREVFEIPEVRAWFEKAESAVLGWSYYLDLESSNSTLLVFLTCTCKGELRGLSQDGMKKLIWFPSEELEKFLERQFTSLNHFTKRHGISHTVNAEISHAISDFIEMIASGQNF